MRIQTKSRLLLVSSSVFLTLLLAGVLAAPQVSTGRAIASGVTTRVSLDSSGTEANGASFEAAISADGRYVAFASSANNLVSGDGNGFQDVFLRDRDVDRDGVYDEVRHVSTALIASLNLPSARALDPARPRASFDADGRADLAIGVPYEDIESISGAGAVNVLYGTSLGGLGAAGNQIWHQDSPGVLDEAKALDRFGFALAVGDFDGDGRADLAIGVPGEGTAVTVENHGAVHVLYGADSGLTATGDQVWTQDSPGIEGMVEYMDQFGYVLAVGDLNGDGYDDLAIGVPYEDVESLSNAGAVNVIYGSASGLTAAGDQIWHQDSPGISGFAETDDYFGHALAAGDFDRDGYDDLAIGVRYEDLGTAVDTGSVNVIYGSAGGLTSVGDWELHQDTIGILDYCETDDYFGWALAAGDLNGDGYTDLAVGVNGENVGTIDKAGAVNVVYGSASGLTTVGNQFWHQDVAGVEGTCETGDRFGRVLTVGDFDGDGYDDLVVGIPFEDVGGIVDAGSAHVFYGSSVGLTALGDWWFHQDIQGMVDTAEGSDHFGHALAAGDFDGDGYTDLAIGVPYESVGAIEAAGAVHAVYGSIYGLTTGGDQLWHQDIPGVEGMVEGSDQFGYALAALYRVKNDKVYLPLLLKSYGS